MLRFRSLDELLIIMFSSLLARIIIDYYCLALELLIIIILIVELLIIIFSTLLARGIIGYYCFDYVGSWNY